MPAVTVKTETVTVKKARKWLADANEGNRKPKANVVAAYARDLQSGQWIFNGDAIRFNGNGKLIDGQHRLMAVVEAATPMKSIVIRGLDSESKFVIDTGAKRNLGDVLHYQGYTHTTLLAAAIRWCITYERGSMTAFEGGGRSVVTVSEALGWLDANKRIVDVVKYVGNLRFPYGAARMALIAIMYYNRTHGSGDARVFIEQLVTGEQLQAGNPIHKLRTWYEWVYLRQGRLRGNREIQAVTVKAWNAYMRGEQIAVLRYRIGGAKPEAFPTIVVADA